MNHIVIHDYKFDCGLYILILLHRVVIMGNNFRDNNQMYNLILKYYYNNSKVPTNLV